MSDGLGGYLEDQYPDARERAKVLEAYRVFFDMHPAVARDLGRFCGYFAGSFHETSDRITSFNEGKRSVFLHVTELVNLSPKQVGDLLRVELPEEG
jgi:hypothetical protein